VKQGRALQKKLLGYVNLRLNSVNPMICKIFLTLSKVIIELMDIESILDDTTLRLLFVMGKNES
jgi:hypothetical protein